MPEPKVLWTEADSEETVAAAFERLAGRPLNFESCMFEEIRGSCSVYYFRDGWQVTVAWDGACSVARVLEEGGSS